MCLVVHLYMYLYVYMYNVYCVYWMCVKVILYYMHLGIIYVHYRIQIHVCLHRQVHAHSEIGE